MKVVTLHDSFLLAGRDVQGKCSVLNELVKSCVSDCFLLKMSDT